MDASWMLPKEAIMYVIEHYKGATVVEFGSGHGSEMLAEHLNLYSIEHDEDWLGLTSSTYIHAPIKSNEHATKAGQSGWYDTKIVLQHWPRRVDLVIVDGPPGFIGRFGIMSIQDKLKEVGSIIIDDVDRPDELLLTEKLSKSLGFSTQFFDVSEPRKGGTKRMFAVLTKELNI